MSEQITTSSDRDICSARDPWVVWWPGIHSNKVAKGNARLPRGLFSIIGASTLAWGSIAWAQEIPPEVEQKMELYQSVHESLPTNVRDRLSGSGLNLHHVMMEWDEFQSRMERASEAEGEAREGALELREDERTESFDTLSSFNIVPVSDPDAIEDQLSAYAGFTQSETDTAKCGHTIVVGFNDSGSFIQTLFGGVSPSGSFSFNGWSRSSDSGDTFDDRGILLADPLPLGVLFRDLGSDP
jgi:hypothetical protein